MARLTIRNIPESVLEQIKTLSQLERRSMNSQTLVLLETALHAYRRDADMEHSNQISTETQTAVWERLSGEWDDERSTKDIIADIYSNRTN
ncbi:MAG: Arc family DNA-binding protein [Spirochaeta sp.]|jgi:plasmid stability protein|nr:Arc family DNA-binding protein [Spirochaeta sp.]